MQERGMIGIKNGAEGKTLAFGCRGAQKILVRIVKARGGPRSTARLQQPKSGDVLQKADGSADAAFVGEVLAAGFCGNYRSGQLRAEQRPRRRTHDGAGPRCGNS